MDAKKTSRAKIVKKTFVVLTCIIIMLSASGCQSQKTKKMLQGTWYEDLGIMQIMISDKVCMIQDYSVSSTEPATSILKYGYKDGKLVLERFDGEQVELSVRFSSDKKSIIALTYAGRSFGKEAVAAATLLDYRVDYDPDKEYTLSQLNAINDKQKELRNLLSGHYELISDLYE